MISPSHPPREVRGETEARTAREKHGIEQRNERYRFRRPKLTP